MDIKKDDAVKIIAGKDKGQTGTVTAVYPATNKIIVEGLNMVTKHVRARKADEKSGIRTQPAPLDASNAMVVCPVCLKATRIAIGVDDEGNKARFCKKCGANIDANSKAGKSTVRKAKRASKKEKANADSDDK